MDPEEPRRGGLRIGGIPVSVPWSGVIGVLLIAWLWLPQFRFVAGGRTEQLVLAGVFAVLLYLSILAHELAHAAAARSFGYPVRSIVLWVLGGFTVYERRDVSPGREAVIAAAGPATTLVLAAACWWASRVTGTDGTVGVLLWSLAWGNAFMGVYNLLPGLPLDGGAILKSAVWGLTGSEPRGGLVAAWSGRVVAVSLVAVPVVLIVAGGGQPSLSLLMTAGLFAVIMWTGASQALRRARLEARLPAVSAAALARPVLTVPAELPLAEALRRRDAAGAAGLLVVDPAGRAVALVHAAAVDATPVERRPWVPVSAVARTLDPATVLPVGLGGEDLLERLGAFPAGEYLVVDDRGTVTGILVAADVERALSA